MAETKARLPFASVMRVTSPYGRRLDPITGEVSRHGGIDLVGVDGRIVAVMGGVVAVSQMVVDRNDRTWEWGNYV